VRCFLVAFSIDGRSILQEIVGMFSETLSETKWRD
jgi:hypothetical protein